MAWKKFSDGVKSYHDFEVYSFKIKEVMFDKPIYLGFTFLELPNLYMYEIFYDILQTFSDSSLEENVLIRYMGCDSFIFSRKTNDFIRDLKNLQVGKGFIVFSKTAGCHPLYCNENTDVIGKTKIETPGTIKID